MDSPPGAALLPPLPDRRVLHRGRDGIARDRPAVLTREEEDVGSVACVDEHVHRVDAELLRSAALQRVAKSVYEQSRDLRKVYSDAGNASKL